MVTMSTFQLVFSSIILSFNLVISTEYIDNVTTPINDSFILNLNDTIWSRSRNTYLVFHTLGNLVLYTRENTSSSFYSKFASISNTANKNATTVELMSSGKLVIKDKSNDIIWQSKQTLASNSIETQPHRLSVIDECVYLINKNYKVSWSRGDCNCSHPSFFAPTPHSGEPTASPTPSPVSTHKDYVIIPTNTSFVLKDSRAIWSKPMDTSLAMQYDGNLVLYHRDTCFKKAIWNTGREGFNNGPPYMEISSDGNITLNNNDSTVYWQSNTTGNIDMQPFRLIVAQDCVYLMDTNLTIFWQQGPKCNNLSISHPTSAPSQSPLTALPTSNPFRYTLHPTQYPTEHPTKYPLQYSTANDATATAISNTKYVVMIHSKHQGQSEYVMVILVILLIFLLVVIVLLLYKMYRKKALKEQIDDNPGEPGAMENAKNEDFEDMQHEDSEQAITEEGGPNIEDDEQAITEEGDRKIIYRKFISDNNHNPNIAPDEFVVIGDDQTAGN